MLSIEPKACSLFNISESVEDPGDEESISSVISISEFTDSS